MVHGTYNVATGIILNDMIGKATLYSNTVQHNVLWLAYGGVAAMVCLVTRGRLGFRARTTPGIVRDKPSTWISSGPPIIRD